MSLVLTILDFLYNNYGSINPQQINNKTTIVKSTTYNLAQPINLIFNSINDPVEYALAADSELTQSQTINLALVILHEQQMFKYDIRAWKLTTPAYKNWKHFKNNFWEAYLELRETGGTIDELGLQNANAIVYQIMVRLQIDEYERTGTAA